MIIRLTGMKEYFLDNAQFTFEHSMIRNEVIKMGARVKFIDSYETPTFRDVFKKFKRYGYYYLLALKKYANLVLHHSLHRRAYFTIRVFTPLCF